jgi:hypothetical protein
MSDIPHREFDELDASLRILSHHDIAHDSTVTRIDVLFGLEKNPSNQYWFGFTSGSPGKTPLHFPPTGKGVIGSYDVRANSGDIVLALRGLATAIEAHKAKKT